MIFWFTPRRVAFGVGFMMICLGASRLLSTAFPENAWIIGWVGGSAAMGLWVISLGYEP